MTDEVGTLVLRDNFLQTQAISVTEQLGGHLLDRVARLMRQLEKEGRLHRGIEFLPDEDPSPSGPGWGWALRGRSCRCSCRIPRCRSTTSS